MICKGTAGHSTSAATTRCCFQPAAVGAIELVPVRAGSVAVLLALSPAWFLAGWSCFRQRFDRPRQVQEAGLARAARVPSSAWRFPSAGSGWPPTPEPPALLSLKEAWLPAAAIAFWGAAAKTGSRRTGWCSPSGRRLPRLPGVVAGHQARTCRSAECARGNPPPPPSRLDLPAGSRVPRAGPSGGGTIDLALVALGGGQGRAAPLIAQLAFALPPWIWPAVRHGVALCPGCWLKARAWPWAAETGIAWDRRVTRRCCSALRGRWLEAADSSNASSFRAVPVFRALVPPPGRTPAGELRLSPPGPGGAARAPRACLQLLDGFCSRRCSQEDVAQGVSLRATVDAARLPLGGTSRNARDSSWLRGGCARCFRILDQHPALQASRRRRCPSPLGWRLRSVLGPSVSCVAWDSRSEPPLWHPCSRTVRAGPTARSRSKLVWPAAR